MNNREAGKSNEGRGEFVMICFAIVRATFSILS
jgi:hypothetical protein